jgi:ankyrin repeat protein
LSHPEHDYPLYQDGRTPLHVAASSGGIDTTRFLLDQKADVNAKDSMGWTPLMIAGQTANRIK